MDPGVDSVTETDVVSELIEFAIDRELVRIRTGVGNEREAIARGHHRVRDREIAIEEKLQHRNASTANHSVPSRVGRVRRRTFGKSLRQQPSPILVEALLESLRVQDDVAQLDVGFVLLPGLNQMDEPADSLRARTEDAQTIFDTTRHSRPRQPLP